MAIIPSVSFPGQSSAPSANYPLGSAQDISSPGAGDGTPYVANLLNDFWGFFQAMLADAGIAASGVPDDALVSQYLEAAKLSIGVNPGMIGFWPADGLPSGWLVCDGSSIATATYPNLFAAIGTEYGSAGAGFFNLPDLRGEFPRFLDQGAGIDPDVGARLDRGDGTTGDNPGTKQGFELQSHTHDAEADEGSTGTGRFVAGVDFDTTLTTEATGGNETRPTNIAFIGLIKY